MKRPPPDTLQPDDIKKGMLMVASVVGGGIIGYGAAQSYEHGFIEERLEEPMSDVQAVIAFEVANVGLCIFAASYMEAIKEFGLGKVAAFTLGLPAVALVIRAVRNA